MHSTPPRAPRRVPSQRPGPAGGKRDLNRKRRIQDICAAATGLMLEAGVERVTIDEICKSAGIAKGSFYRYFNDKTELVEAILDPLATAMRTILDTCEADIHEAKDFAALTTAYVRVALHINPIITAEKATLQLYLQESRGPAVGARAPIRALADEFGAMAERLTLPAQENGLLRPLPAAVTGRIVVGAVERLAFDVLTGAVNLAVPTIAQALITTVLDGVRAPT